MNWEAIGAVGEILGALAVVLSLFYLALQIRTQNRESKLSAVHEIKVGARESMSIFGRSDLADLLSRGRHGMGEFSEAERIQLISAIQGTFMVWEDAYYQYLHGRLEEDLWHSMARQFEARFDIQAVREVWELRRYSYTEDFQEFVNSMNHVTYRTSLTDPDL